MFVKIDPEGPRRSKKDPVRLRKLRQTSQAAFAASSFSSWLYVETCMNDLSSAGVTLKFCCPRNLIKLGSEKFPCRSHGAGTYRESRILCFQNISISFGTTLKRKHICVLNLSQKMPEKIIKSDFNLL